MKSGPHEDGYFLDKRDAEDIARWLFRMSKVHMAQIELLTPEEAFAVGGLLGVAFRIKDALKLTMEIPFDEQGTAL